MNPHPYAVIKIGARQNNLMFRSLTDRRDYLTTLQCHSDCEWIGDFSEDGQIYWCDNEQSAEQTAVQLTRLYPNNNYAVVKTTVVFHRPPGELTRSVYNEQGFFPE